MISNDPKILEEGSVVTARQKEYAKQFEELHILYVTGRLISHSPFAAVIAGEKIMRGRGFGPNDLITVQDPFLTASVGVSLKKKFGSKLEIQIHTDIGSPYYAKESLTNKMRLWSARKNLPKADHARVVSERIKEFLISNFQFPVSKIEVRPIFVDTERIKNAPITVDLHKKYPQFKKIIFMASRLTREKDIPTALRAFALLRKRAPDSGLIIVGSGPEKFKASTNVIFENWLDQPTLFSYYKTADVFLSTSLYEGYGMAMVEAHAAGCPIVSTDVGIAPEIAKKICHVGDVECLALSLSEMLEKNT